MFGGIVNCATIAKGIVAASRNLGLKIPLVVRLEGTLYFIPMCFYKRIFLNLCSYYLLGTNVDEAKKILADSGLPILTATNLDEAATKAVASIQK